MWMMIGVEWKWTLAESFTPKQLPGFDNWMLSLEAMAGLYLRDFDLGVEGRGMCDLPAVQSTKAK